MFEPINSRRTRWAPSPLMGEGWGEGLVGKASVARPLTRPPSLRCAQLWRPTSPTRGEVDRACCAVTTLQRLRLLYQAFLSPGTRIIKLLVPLLIPIASEVLRMLANFG